MGRDWVLYCGLLLSIGVSSAEAPKGVRRHRNGADGPYLLENIAIGLQLVQMEPEGIVKCQQNGVLNLQWSGLQGTRGRPPLPANSFRVNSRVQLDRGPLDNVDNVIKDPVSLPFATRKVLRNRGKYRLLEESR
jgi:hypothetical protein